MISQSFATGSAPMAPAMADDLVPKLKCAKCDVKNLFSLIYSRTSPLWLADSETGVIDHDLVVPPAMRKPPARGARGFDLALSGQA